MPKVAVYNSNGEQVGEQELNPSVFAANVNEAAMHEVVVAHMANQRRGTAETKTRGFVRGGGKKPWRQKGTGRARHGSSRSPIWRGGGVTFGPNPNKNYKVKVNKKAGKLAFKSILSLRLANNQLIVVDKLQLDEGKTKHFQEIYNSLVQEGRAIFVD